MADGKPTRVPLIDCTACQGTGLGKGHSDQRDCGRCGGEGCYPAWLVIEGSLGNHVVPLDDLKEHDVDGACWCHPTDDEGVLVHHSMDGREKIETGERLAS